MYNGKIDNPQLYDRALTVAEIKAIEQGAGASGATANWNFSRKIRSNEIVDTSSNALNGTSVDLPERGVTGHNWDASTFDYTLTPAQYGAIYFHDDDLADANTSTGFLALLRRPAKALIAAHAPDKSALTPRTAGTRPRSCGYRPIAMLTRQERRPGAWPPDLAPRRRARHETPVGTAAPT